MEHEEIMKEINAGIECPVCGTILYEQEPQGVFAGNPYVHVFECDECGVAVLISERENFESDEDE